MPDVTPNLGLKRPLGNETVTREAYNENLVLLDQNAAKAEDFQAQTNDLASFKLNLKRKMIMGV